MGWNKGETVPIPRFINKSIHRRYEIVLACTQCGFAVVKDGHTEGWMNGPCRLHEKYGCTGTLVAKQVDYGPG